MEEIRYRGDSMFGLKDIEDKIDEKITEQDQKTDEIGKKITEQNQKINALDEKITQTTKSIDEINEKLAEQEQKNWYRKMSIFLNNNPIVGIFLPAIIWPILTFLFVFSKIPAQIETIQEDINGINTKIETINRNLKYINNELGINIDFANVPDDFIESSEAVNENDEYMEVIENSDNVIQTGYYSGRTSDGYYNDDTGDAYIIKYFPDGMVKTLYVGKFVDGMFNDRTDNAWYITKEIKTDYMYYKGYFEDGEALGNATSYFEGPSLSIDRINEILKENNFKKELNWYSAE